jgi:hypothetical protein
MTRFRESGDLARLEGFEPPAHGLEVRSSIHLSYRRLTNKYTTSLVFRQGKKSHLKKNTKTNSGRVTLQLRVALDWGGRYQADLSLLFHLRLKGCEKTKIFLDF